MRSGMHVGQDCILRPIFNRPTCGEATAARGRLKIGRRMQSCPTIALLLAFTAHAQTLQQAESLWRAHQYKEAGQAFEALVKTQPKNPDYKVRYGRLLLERFNRADAASLFQEALAIKKDHPGALLGMALVAADGFEGKAAELAHEALKSDPQLLDAQELLARLALEDNNPAKATEEADKTLKLSPNAPDAM